MPTEFNWYLVTDDKDLKFDGEGGMSTIKEGIRIYPIDMPIPFIIKGKGCFGIIKVISIKHINGNTEIECGEHRPMAPNDEISQHYYKLYLEMKGETQ